MEVSDTAHICLHDYLHYNYVIRRAVDHSIFAWGGKPQAAWPTKRRNPPGATTTKDFGNLSTASPPAVASAKTALRRRQMGVCSNSYQHEEPKEHFSASSPCHPLSISSGLASNSQLDTSTMLVRSYASYEAMVWNLPKRPTPGQRCAGCPNQLCSGHPLGKAHVQIKMTETMVRNPPKLLKPCNKTCNILLLWP